MEHPSNYILAGRAVGSLKRDTQKGWDKIRGKKKRPPRPRETELAIPDEDELKRAARRRQSMLAQRSGRASTILDDETLG